jgi:polyisoprenoid-binding protein YceI
MRWFRSSVVALAASLLLAACASAPAPAPTVPPMSPTPATTQASSSATGSTSPTAAPTTTPSVIPTPTAGTSAATATPTTATTATAASTVPAAGDVITFRLVPSASEARYRAREQLVSRPLPNDAIGRTTAITGVLTLTTAGAIVPEHSRLTVDLRTLKSDEGRRDRYIQQNTLETQRFPLAEFVPTQAIGITWPPPTSGEATFRLVGDLTVHGVTRPVTWDVTAQFAGERVTGMATTTVKMTDFGMTPPRAGPVLSIEDSLRLEVDFQAIRS